jgi:hypothetical protein
MSSYWIISNSLSYKLQKIPFGLNLTIHGGASCSNGVNIGADRILSEAYRLERGEYSE